MLKPQRLVPLLFVAVLVCSIGAAMGQQPFRQYGRDPFIDRPAVSPYMNLMYRERGSAGQLNYFTRVLPQLQAQEQAARQWREMNRLQGQISQLGAQAAQGTGTGHRTYFGNLSHFYNYRPAGAQGPGR